MRGVPQATIKRLVIYYRYLNKISQNSEDEVISSLELGKNTGTNAAKVRKDLSYFGDFGRKGVGYDIERLKKNLGKILGCNDSCAMVLVGAGNLGRALVNYQEFKKLGLNIVDIFDNDLNKIGNRVGKFVVKSSKNLQKNKKKKNIQIGIIAVPPEEAQSVANDLVNYGIGAVWNFAPVSLNLPDEVIVFYEDLSSSIVTLNYRLHHKKQ